MKPLPYTLLMFVWLMMLALNGYSQILNKQSLNGKAYYALLEHGNYILQNDTEEAFYEHFIIEFKNDKAFIRHSMSSTLNYDSVLNIKPIGHDYVVKDSIITIPDLKEWDIRILQRSFKLVASSRLYSIRVLLEEIKTK